MKEKRLYAAPALKVLEIGGVYSLLTGSSGIKAMRNNYEKDTEEWED